MADFRPIFANTFAFLWSTTGLDLVELLSLRLLARSDLAADVLDFLASAAFLDVVATALEGAFPAPFTATLRTFAPSGDLLVLRVLLDLRFCALRFFSWLSSLYNDKSTKSHYYAAAESRRNATYGRQGALRSRRAELRPLSPRPRLVSGCYPFVPFRPPGV